MTEEEKKTVEFLKEIVIEFDKCNSEYVIDKYDEYGFLNGFRVVLNLIEKLQKENEKLRQSYDKATTEMEELKEQKEIDMYLIGDSISKEIVKRDYISKGEIRKLDNECFPRHEVGFFKGQRIMGTNECTYFAQKILELLEEE